MKQTIKAFFIKDNIRYEVYRDEVLRQNRELFKLLTQVGVPMSLGVLVTTTLYKNNYMTIMAAFMFLYFSFLFALGDNFLEKAFGKVTSKQMYVIIEIPILTCMIMSTIFAGRGLTTFVYMILLLTFPLFIIDKPQRMFAFITFNGVAFLILDMIFKSSSVFLVDMTHLITTWIASVSISFLLNGTRLEGCEFLSKTQNHAEHHQLTGLKNRYALQKDAAMLVGSNVKVIMFDLDDFKFFNDMYGHSVGDEVIREFGRVLESSFGADHCYSYGGDEFLVVVDDSMIATKSVIESQREHLLNMTIDDLQLHPSFSCGYVEGNLESVEMLFDMIVQADLLMYRGKRHGKGRTVGQQYAPNGQLEPIDGSKEESSQQQTDDNGKLVQTFSDPLTDLPNMAYFRTTVGYILDNVADMAKKPAFAYINLENFKSFNDSHGFKEGDRLLIYIAELLKKYFPDRTASRLADDHFVVMIYEEELERFDKMREDLKKYTKDSLLLLKVGVCRYEEGMNVATVCDHAKEACDSLHHNPRLLMRFFDDELEHAIKMEQYVINNLSRAIEEGWIQVFYQPIIRSMSGNVCSLEALARWNDPERGMISPGDFIPILEKHHIVGRLDKFMVEQVCREFRKREEIGLEPVPVSINLSRLDLEYGDSVEESMEILERYDVKPEQIIFEITESVVTTNSELLHRQLDRFHEKGFKVWLDDFGSGYSSLHVLQEYDFDLVKLDMSFMRSYEKASRTSIMIKEIVYTAKKLGMETLAEGVETIEQVHYLRLVRCDRMQGFFFAAPHPYDAEETLSVKNELIEYLNEEEYYSELGKFELEPTGMVGPMLDPNFVVDGIPAALIEWNKEKLRTLRSTRGYYNVMRYVDLPETEHSERWNFTPDEDFLQVLEEAVQNEEGTWSRIHAVRNKDLELSFTLKNVRHNERSGADAFHVVICGVRKLT